MGADLGIRLLESAGCRFECVKSDFRTNFGERWSAVMVPGKRSAHTAEEARVREIKKLSLSSGNLSRKIMVSSGKTLLER